MHRFNSTASVSRALATGSVHNAATRQFPEYNWHRLRAAFLTPPTEPRERREFLDAQMHALTGAALDSDLHPRILTGLRNLHSDRVRDGSRALTQEGADHLETASPAARGRYAAATLSQVMSPRQLSEVQDRLTTDPNYLARGMVQQELDSGVDWHRARELNARRAHWESQTPQGRSLGQPVAPHEVDAAMKMFEPRTLDRDKMQPWEHAAGPAMHPVVDALNVALRKSQFENGDHLTPITSDMYRTVPRQLHGDLSYPVFHHAVERFMRGHNYKSERPEPGTPQLQSQELTDAFNVSGSRGPLVSPLSSPKSSITRPGDEGDVRGPLWTAENRPSERKAKSLADMGRWLETESARRGLDVHPLAHELYRPSYASGSPIAPGAHSITPNPEAYDTHLSRFYDLEFVPRTFDPKVSDSEPWHKRLRNTPWTPEEARGEGVFDTESRGTSTKALTFNHILRFPHTLVNNTYPVGTRFRKNDSGALVPTHVMQDGRRMEVPGTPAPGALEEPRLHYRVYHPAEMHTALSALHGNELYAHVYDLLAQPKLDRHPETGRIGWMVKHPTTGAPVPDKGKDLLVSRSMGELQGNMQLIGHGRPATLRDGTEVPGMHLGTEYAGLGRTLQSLVIPRRPQDTERGLRLLHGLKNVAPATDIRSLLENFGDPGSNAHTLSFLHDWHSKLAKATSETPDDPRLKMIHEGIQRFVPDLMGPPGYTGNAAHNERKQAGRIITSDVSANLRRLSRQEDWDQALQEGRLHKDSQEVELGGGEAEPTFGAGDALGHEDKPTFGGS